MSEDPFRALVLCWNESQDQDDCRHAKDVPVDVDVLEKVDDLCTVNVHQDVNDDGDEEDDEDLLQV